MQNIQHAFHYITTHFTKIGREGVKAALVLWFALTDERTPFWIKPVIVAALVYLATPVDAIPDILPPGFYDDLALVAGTVIQISGAVDAEVIAKAEAMTRRLFGF